MLPHNIHFILASGFTWYWAILLAMLAGLLTARAYTRPVRELAGARWMLPAFFRGLGALLLLLLILRPELDIEKTVTDPHTMLLLLDRSASMSLRDQEGGPRRLRQGALVALDCERLVAGAPGLALRVVPFAEAPSPPVSGEDILGLEASGDESDICEALSQSANITPPLRRVMLLSDGNDTTGMDPVRFAGRLGVPVDTVAIGRDLRESDAFRDVFLEGLEHRDSAPVGSITQIVANVDATGFSGRTVTVSLRSGNETLARGELVLDALKGPQPVTLNFHPTTPGMMDLTVMVIPLAGEKVAENNIISFPLSVHEKLPRIVYVEGSIRPDYKFMRRVLATDPGLEFMSLVRIRDDDFLRQGSVSGMELGGIPRTRAELSAFDVLIMGNLSAVSVGSDILSRIRDAVGDGLGLLIVSGPFITGIHSDYGGTPLAHVFPAVPAHKPGPAGVGLQPFLTRAGRDHALGQGLARFFSARKDLAESVLPPLNGVDPVARIRPASTTVLAAILNGKTLPLLVTGRFGKGKVAMFLGHDAWQWSLGRRRFTNPYAQLWGQVVRWLAADDKQKQPQGPSFSVTANRLVARAGQEIVFSASVRGFAATAPRIVATVLRGNRKVDSIGFGAVPSLDGVFQGRFVTRRTGKYRVRVRAMSGKKIMAERILAIRVRGGRGEFERLSPNRKLLARMARETGGRVLSLQNLAAHAADFAAAERTRQEIVHLRLWHRAWMFSVMVAFFSLEWILRKRAGLA